MIELPRSVRRLILCVRRNVWCLIDAVDYEWLSAWRWNIGWHSKTPWKFYAKRNVGPARSTVYLHREVLARAEPMPPAFMAAHHGDHKNGNALDNRRANLRWATPLANTQNRFARGEAPTLEQIGAQLWAAEPAYAEAPF